MSEAEVIEKTVLDMLLGVWNFSLFNIDGSPITIGKLIIGIVLITMGYYFAIVASRAFGRRVISKLEIDESIKYSFERLAFYMFYVLAVLFSLQLLSIPITVFTMLGGALAIGFGFGSQNVVNNFISGLIVMVEQPVRVGDWIELDGIFGRVEQIGSRSTYLRNADNKQTIIPNSFFLERAITNWTLSDNLVSGRLNVGVAYGSDTAKVKQLLLQAAGEHASVVKTPEPGVLFQDFGDSSLNFSLIFWIQFSATNTVNMVASDLRFRIDQLFRTHAISIPFPHRELLLDPNRPVRVTLDRH